MGATLRIDALFHGRHMGATYTFAQVPLMGFKGDFPDTPNSQQGSGRHRHRHRRHVGDLAMSGIEVQEQVHEARFGSLLCLD